MVQVNNEKPSSWYDEQYAAQLNKGGQYSLDPVNTVYRELWQKALSWIGNNERVADYGCGVGQFAELLIKAGKRYVYGIDFSEVAISEAKRRNHEYDCLFHCRDLRDKESYYFIYYDVVVITEVLEHITFDKFVLKNIPSEKHVIFSVQNYAYSAHVRHFEETNEIHDRYGKLLDIKSIAKIKMSSGGKCIWLCDAYKK